jgi:hypothetical protein
MAIIDQREDVFTLVNVFTVTPEKQDTLVQLLIEATNKTMRTNPEAIPHMKAAAALASFDPITCEVSESIAH